MGVSSVFTLKAKKGVTEMAYKDKTKTISYNNDYNKGAYDRVSLMLKKGKKEIIQQVASANGESVNAFINRAIDMLLSQSGK